MACSFAPRPAGVELICSYWQDGRLRQRVISTLGRLDKLQGAGAIDEMLKSLSRFSEKVKVCEDYKAGRLEAKRVIRIGRDLVLGRLWRDLGIGSAINELSGKRNFSFALERAIYLATWSRLFFPGSDRRARRMTRDYRVTGAEDIELHHLYRAMVWIGDQKEQPEEMLFLPKTGTCSGLFPSSSSMPPVSILRGKAGSTWGNGDTPKTGAPMRTRWWGEPSSAMPTAPSAPPCGRATPPT